MEELRLCKPSTGQLKPILATCSMQQSNAATVAQPGNKFLIVFANSLYVNTKVDLKHATHFFQQVASMNEACMEKGHEMIMTMLIPKFNIT